MSTNLFNNQHHPATHVPSTVCPPLMPLRPTKSHPLKPRYPNFAESTIWKVQGSKGRDSKKTAGNQPFSPIGTARHQQPRPMAALDAREARERLEGESHLSSTSLTINCASNTLVRETHPSDKEIPVRSVRKLRQQPSLPTNSTDTSVYTRQSLAGKTQFLSPLKNIQPPNQKKSPTNQTVTSLSQVG